MALTQVFQPIRIGSVEIKNRVVCSAHDTGYAARGIDERFIAYHVERAKGGVGLMILEAAAVHASSEVSAFLRCDHDSVIPGYNRLMQAVRPHGMRVFQQLWHGGHHHGGLEGTTPWSASALPGPVSGLAPIPMTIIQINEIVRAFAVAAVRCQDGGLDGVELHAAHGDLFMQFLSPLSNQRDDRYGGSLENRTRFLHDALRAVRKAVGDDFPVGVRVSASTATGGLKEEELAEVVRGLQAEGLIDHLNVSLGDYYEVDAMVGGMHRPAGYQLESSGKVVQAGKVPRIVGGRFRTLEEAEAVLAQGTADMVSMVRAHIADPMLVRKTQAGTPGQVRPCLGCNQGCTGTSVRPGLTCAVNAAVGQESTLAENLIVKVAAAKKVLVVGGGPAGLEAARVAALRGHKVILAEAAAQLGGMVGVAKLAPQLQGLADITDWLEREVRRLGVEVRTSKHMDADAVAGERANHVIIATGSVPKVEGLQIALPGEPAKVLQAGHAITSTALLTDKNLALGKSALVLDDVGHYEAIAAAEFLIGRGVAVTLVTRFPMLAPLMENTGRVQPALERLYRGSFELLTRHALVEAQPGQSVVRPLQSRKTRAVPADTVVLVTVRKPLRELFVELGERGVTSTLQMIGDAATPRNLRAAIAEGHQAARELN